MTPIDFQLTWSKVKFKLMVVSSISRDPLIRWKCAKFGTVDAPRE